MQVSIASWHFHLFLATIGNFKNCILVSMLHFHLFHEILQNVSLLTFWVLMFYFKSMLLLPLFAQYVRMALFHNLWVLTLFIKV